MVGASVMRFPCCRTPRISRPPDRRQICACTFDDWLGGRLHAVVRRRRSGTVYGPAHAGPAQASLQDAEGQDLETLVVRARSLAGKAAAALLLCERTLPGRAVAHSILRHMNDEDGTLRRLTNRR